MSNKTFAIQNQWSDKLEHTLGSISLSEDAIKIIETSPEVFRFGISFTGELQEDGTYKNCKLMGVSLITKGKEE